MNEETKYELVPMEEEVENKYKLISDNGEKYGEFSIYDLADHQVRLERQIVELENADIEHYPSRDIELEQSKNDLVTEKEIAEYCITLFSLELNFDDLVKEIRG